MRIVTWRGIRLACVLLALWIAGGAVLAGAARAAERPNVLLLTIDTLRTDRMSSYGHDRPTSPRMDALLASGARFTEARTPAPLTAPAMASMLTSMHPHDHGSSRNGLRVRPNLVTFPRILGRRGYRTAAFVGNWTLRPKLSGLDEHFETYQALLNRKRWFGLAKREATADDLNADALGWLDEHLDDHSDRPFMLWIHYVEPHAPYQLKGQYTKRLGIKKRGSILSARKRYDTEIAYVDERVGAILDEVFSRVAAEDTLVVLAADHGESLGEHGYWGHGRHLYEVTLRVPMGFAWEGHIEPATVEAPASLVDIAPTVLSLVGLQVPGHFAGFDWSGMLEGAGNAPTERITWHQAHKSSVQPSERIEQLRQRGLLEVGRVVAGRKEIFRVPSRRVRIFDLEADRAEKDNLVDPDSRLSEELRDWLARVRKGLRTADELPPPSLSEEDVEALKALGYID